MEKYDRSKLRSWKKAKVAFHEKKQNRDQNNILQQWNPKVVQKQRGKPGEMGKAVAIPPDKEAEKKEMFKVT